MQADTKRDDESVAEEEESRCSVESSCPSLDTCTNLGPVLPTIILLYCTSFSLHQYDITVCCAKFEENSEESRQPSRPSPLAADITPEAADQNELGQRRKGRPAL
jgi:hypothetical protein